MTSLKQIEANRRNAQKSTGPRSDTGKKRASRNALRHGLTAETVIEPIEDAEDYQSFEEAVAASFDPETAVERELILRLASLLWRLRRATSIETGLFQIDSATAADKTEAHSQTGFRPHTHNPLVRIVRSPYVASSNQACGMNGEVTSDTDSQNRPSESVLSVDMQLLLARRFMGLAGLDGAFERITRYEVVLWRQARQVLLALEGLRRRRSGPRYRGPRNGWQASEVIMSDEEN